MAGKYQAYPEYKDCGVEWLGSVPEHWQLTRVKYISLLTPKKPNILRDLECSFVPMEKLKTDSIILDEICLVDDVYDGYTYFLDEDVLMAKVTPCFENKNIAVAKGLVNKIGFGSTEIYVIRVNEKASNRFLYYRLQEDSFMEVATAAMTGAGGLRRVPSDVVNNFTAAFPVVAEQVKITHFLDHETAKIDTLIEKQQQLIKLLKEKRQAVISHAVTKGLNPNAPMRDSDVEWLGEVPAHWDVMQIRRVVKLMEQGKSPECENRVAELQEWGVLKTSCVNNSIYNCEANKTLPSSIVPFPQYEVKIGDVLMSRASGSINLIGSVAYVYKTRPRILLSDKIFRLHLDTKINGVFFGYLMQSSYMRTNIENSISGAEGMANNITKGAVVGFKLGVPPIEEQKEIIKYLARNLDQLSVLIEKAEIAIELMQERRTALISAAVTGKIDVRDWQMPNV